MDFLASRLVGLKSDLTRGIPFTNLQHIVTGITLITVPLQIRVYTIFYTTGRYAGFLKIGHPYEKKMIHTRSNSQKSSGKRIHRNANLSKEDINCLPINLDLKWHCIKV